MAGTVWQLLIARFFLASFSGAYPSRKLLIRKYTPDGMESRSYSFNTSTMSLGNMIGPITGGALSGWIGIKGLFLVSAVMLMINAGWVWQSLLRKRPLPKQQGKDG